MNRDNAPKEWDILFDKNGEIVNLYELYNVDPLHYVQISEEEVSKVMHEYGEHSEEDSAFISEKPLKRVVDYLLEKPHEEWHTIFTLGREILNHPQKRKLYSQFYIPSHGQKIGSILLGKAKNSALEGSLNQAIREYDVVINSFKAFPALVSEALYSKGKIAEERGDLGEAENLYIKSIDLGGNNYNAKLNLGQLVTEREPNWAKNLFLMVYNHNENSVPAIDGLIRCYSILRQKKRKSFEQIEINLERAIKEEAFMLAKLRQKRENKAQKDFEVAQSHYRASFIHKHWHRKLFDKLIRAGPRKAEPNKQSWWDWFWEIKEDPWIEPKIASVCQSIDDKIEGLPESLGSEMSEDRTLVGKNYESIIREVRKSRKETMEEIRGEIEYLKRYQKSGVSKTLDKIIQMVEKDDSGERDLTGAQLTLNSFIKRQGWQVNDSLKRIYKTIEKMADISTTDKKKSKVEKQNEEAAILFQELVDPFRATRSLEAEVSRFKTEMESIKSKYQSYGHLALYYEAKLELKLGELDKASTALAESLRRESRQSKAWRLKQELAQAYINWYTPEIRSLKIEKKIKEQQNSLICVDPKSIGLVDIVGIEIKKIAKVYAGLLWNGIRHGWKPAQNQKEIAEEKGDPEYYSQISIAVENIGGAALYTLGLWMHSPWVMGAGILLVGEGFVRKGIIDSRDYKSCGASIGLFHWLYNTYTEWRGKHITAYTQGGLQIEDQIISPDLIDIIHDDQFLLPPAEDETESEEIVDVDFNEID